MTYKPQSMPGKPDSVIKREKFEDLMQRYHGQMESALYAAEQVCPYKDMPYCDAEGCAFLEKHGHSCSLKRLRNLMGDHVPQHDIQIPEDDTQAQRKRER